MKRTRNGRPGISFLLCGVVLICGRLFSGTAVAEQEGFVSLLEGDAQAQWRGYDDEKWPSGWVLENGVLFRAKGGDDMMTVDEFGDFELRLEWKISPGGNSGIMYRVSTGDKAPYYSGPEYQILDNKRHHDGKNLKTSAAALYALYAPSRDVTKPVGQWNEARIVVQGNHVEHWLNGVQVVTCEIGSDDWNHRVAESKFAKWPKFGKNRRGHLVLQDHGDAVWYRNIRIRRLSASR